MKKFLILLVSTLLFQFHSFGQEIFELKPTQSMLMTGKGVGQDAIINPYAGEDCLAIVENIGENAFSIRIQSKGKIIDIINIKPATTKMIELLKDYELYLDTDLEGKARVEVKKKKASE